MVENPRGLRYHGGMFSAISTAFNTIFYEPLYNGLIFVLATFPWMDVGMAVILFTILVKLVLLPFSIKAVKTQQQIKSVQPEIDEIKEKHKDDKQTQAMKMMELYQENNIRPFSGFFLILLQLPIIFALYYIFLNGGLPEVQPELLYSFVPIPENISVTFLDYINVTEKSIVLALVAGVTQFIQTHLSFGKNKEETDDSAKDTSFLDGSFKDQFKKGLSMQMKYIFPFVVIGISYSLTAVIAIYWATSNLFHIVQELYVQKVVFSDTKNSDSPQKAQLSKAHNS